jgi:hypothetical protein
LFARGRCDFNHLKNILPQHGFIVLNGAVGWRRVMHGLLRKLTTAYALAGYAFAIALVLGGVPYARVMAGADANGVTIPITILTAPLRREGPDQTPWLRRTIRESPQQAPPQRPRKPARTQFADMDLAPFAG